MLQQEQLQELIPSPLREPDLVVQEALPDDDAEQIPLISSEQDIQSHELVLGKNETLSGLLKRANVSLAQALEACKTLDLVIDTKKFRPGQTFEVFFIDDVFQGLKFEDRTGQTISVLKNKKGEFIPQTKEGIIENKRYALQGFLVSSFSESAQKIGIPKTVIHQAVLALDGRIDFKKDLKQGSPFKIVYEQKMTETGKPVGKSQLLYISLTTHKSICQRYFFTDAAGVQGYYDEKGASTPQTLMKRPLGSSARISSPFGMRIHPILGYQIQHKGIDFAAPMGTPIPAGASGIIQKIGRNGGYGKYILIKHNDTYSTAYGHLNAFADGLRVGSQVKKGEIIGYVGSTGRSTGPHLHYEVVKNKRPVNPLKTHTIPQRILKNQSLEQFKRKKQFIDSIKTTVVVLETAPKEEKKISEQEKSPAFEKKEEEKQTTENPVESVAQDTSTQVQTLPVQKTPATETKAQTIQETPQISTEQPSPQTQEKQTLQPPQQLPQTKPVIITPTTVSKIPVPKIKQTRKKA